MSSDKQHAAFHKYFSWLLVEDTAGRILWKQTILWDFSVVYKTLQTVHNYKVTAAQQLARYFFHLSSQRSLLCRCALLRHDPTTVNQEFLPLDHLINSAGRVSRSPITWCGDKEPLDPCVQLPAAGRRCRAAAELMVLEESQEVTSHIDIAQWYGPTHTQTKIKSELRLTQPPRRLY